MRMSEGEEEEETIENGTVKPSDPPVSLCVDSSQICGAGCFLTTVMCELKHSADMPEWRLLQASTMNKQQQSDSHSDNNTVPAWVDRPDSNPESKTGRDGPYHWTGGTLARHPHRLLSS